MSYGKITTSSALQTGSMFSEENHISQPSGTGKSLVWTAPKNSLRGKSLSVNRSSTVDSAIPTPDITSMFAKMILIMDIHQMLLILTKVSRRGQYGYYSRSAPATELNSIRIVNSTSHQQTTISTVPQSGKARGQVTVANSKSFYYSSSCRITIAFGGNSFHPQ